MGLEVKPLDPFGGELIGFDPRQVQSPDGAAEFLDALTDHALLVARGLDLSGAELVSIGRALGDLEILPEPDKRNPDHPEIFDLSNVRPDGQIVDFDEPQAVFLRGTERWHTDSSFREIPCFSTMLYAIEVPATGGETQFADMRAAWEALPADRQADLDGLRVVHSYEYSRANNPGELEPWTDEERAKYPPVTHPLVRTHPGGRRSLYLGGHASHIESMALDEGRTLLAEVEAEATPPDRVYEHRWQAGDLVMWDNRSTLHRLRPYDIAHHRRVMRRITVAGTEPVVSDT